MKLIASVESVKFVSTPQGLYLKTLHPYHYMVALLPDDDSEIDQVGKDYIIEVADEYYKEKRLYRFDKNNIEKFRLDD